RGMHHPRSLRRILSLVCDLLSPRVRQQLLRADRRARPRATPAAHLLWHHGFLRRTPVVADPRSLLDRGDDRDRGHRASARSVEFDRITYVAAGQNGAPALCILGHALDRSLYLLRAEALRLVDTPRGIDASGRSALGAAPAGVFDIRAIAGDAIRRQH